MFVPMLLPNGLNSNLMILQIDQGDSALSIYRDVMVFIFVVMFKCFANVLESRLYPLLMPNVSS